MMKRNWLGCTVIVACDTVGCGLCWTFDAHPATFAAARATATRAGWDCVRTAEERRDTCRYCQEKIAAASPAEAATRDLAA